jgi:hypothetical protein
VAQAILRAVADRLPDPSRSPSARALDDALLTHVEAITDEARGRLSLLLARVSKKA